MAIRSVMLAQNPHYHTVFIGSNFADTPLDSSIVSAYRGLTASCATDWTLLLNGDLLPAHLNFAQASSRLGNFVTSLQQSGKGQIVVVPGDRDWDKNGKFGLDKIKLLEEFFRKQQIPNVYFPLRKGCPG
ncbi:MAG: hypothetical protein HKN76_05890, partial [Saprospiraceae bacterium]|nr:hypothetical protein [Saprospiraceae bacterium]